MDGPLKNLLVLDLTRVLVGPYCTMILSDLGARVIKVEAPEVGDDSRKFGPFIDDYSAYFMSLNRGKESIALNLKNSDDKKIFDKILDKADILVENFKPGTLEKWGYGWKDVCKKYPKLIYASASGFGQTGPLKELPAYDMVVQGMGGLMSVTGHDGQEPVRVGTSIGDITAWLFTTIGILASLIDKNKHGNGQAIDVSMLDCQIAILENAIARYFATGENPPPGGSRHPAIAPFECYRCKDGYIVMACGNNAMFERMCKAINKAELIEDKRFKTNPERVENVIQLKQELESLFVTKNSNFWIEVLEKENIPIGPLNNIEQAVNSEQIKARNMIVNIDDENFNNFYVAGNPIKMSLHNDPKSRQKVPKLDEHRSKLLKEFNIKE